MINYKKMQNCVCDNDSSTYKMNDTTLEKVDKFRDLGVLFDQYLLFDNHISEKVSKAYDVGNYKKKFSWCIGATEKMFIKLA